MGAGLRIPIITLLLLLSFNLAYSKVPPDYCFQTPWGSTACLSVVLDPEHAKTLDSLVVRLLWSPESGCIWLNSPIDSTRLVENVFTIYSNWGEECFGCPEPGPGQKRFDIGRVNYASLTVQVYFIVRHCGEYFRPPPFEKTFYLNPIPTLSEFGLLIFALLLVSLIIWYLCKARTRATYT